MSNVNPRFSPAVLGLFVLLFISSGCDEFRDVIMGKDPATASVVPVDRFSEDAGTLMVRTPENGLPGPNEPIDFDSGAPFITQGLAPDGSVVRYYNFDAQSATPAPIYAFFYEETDEHVAGQLNVIDVIPGDPGYSDFWHVRKVMAPSDYVVNSITSLDEVFMAGLEVVETDILVNCPVVPDGSTAALRYGGAEGGLVSGWHKGNVVKYISFEEKALSPTAEGKVPLSPIYVTFNINPGEEGGGPASGFATEEDGAQAHNVVATTPADDGYSPLWSVNIYDNAEFDAVSDLPSALGATVLAQGAALVNCPIVFRE